MEFSDVVTMIQNTGVTVVVVAYFMIRDYKFMNTLQDTLTTLVNTVDSLKDIVKAKGD